MRYEKRKVLAGFLEKNANAILEIFNDIEHQNLQENYFSVRESMKLEYLILKKYEHLQKAFVEDQRYLVQCMQNFSTEAESITYEALLLFSFFTIRTSTNEHVKKVLKDNSEKLGYFIENFELHGIDATEEEVFKELQSKMV